SAENQIDQPSTRLGCELMKRILHNRSLRAMAAVAAVLIACAATFSLAASRPAQPAVRSSVLGKVVTLTDGIAEIQAPAVGRILPPRDRPYTVGDRIKKGDPVAILEHRYNLHDASHLSTGRWDLVREMWDAKDAWVSARVAREKAERLMQLGTASGQEVANL